MKFILKPLLLACCFVVACSSALAQKGGTGGGGGAGTKGGGAGAPSVSAPIYGNSSYGNGTYATTLGSLGTCSSTWSCPNSTPRPMPAEPTRDDDTCFLPPAAGIHSATVSVTRLEVPEKAKKEYEKACSALHHKDFAEAEAHLENAIQRYEAYAGAWVLLGQVQELQQRKNEATESCTRGMRIDSRYLPPYLCLAHIAAVEKQWDRVAELTDHVLKLHPINGSNAYYYNALAYLKLRQFSYAENIARRGVLDTKKEDQPLLHLLLAQIYERKGDRSSEIAELRKYLKLAPHGGEAPRVNSILKGMTDDTEDQP